MKRIYKTVIPITLSAMLACTSVLAFSHGKSNSLGDFNLTVYADSAQVEDIQGIVGEYTEDSLGVELFEINLTTAEELDEAIAEIEETNKALPNEGVIEVEYHDWTKYSSDNAANRLTPNEQVFYNRLTSLGNYYIDNSTIDAYWVDAYSMYAVNGVVYSDLGLDSRRAFEVAEWWLYNNPQYYFCRPRFLTTSQAVYMGCYDFAADGDNRADTTNTIFYVVDGVVEAIPDGTAYDKVCNVHNIVVNYLDYVSGTYDQSLYSAVIQGMTVCAGYSELTSVILNSLDIDTYVAISDCHAWNISLFDDGKYYCIDSTWNDSLNNTTFLGCGSSTLRRYDTVDNEHFMSAPFSSWIPDVSVNDYGAIDVVVDTPSNLTTDNLSENSAVCVWNAVSNASYYQVVLATDALYEDVVIDGFVKDNAAILSGLTDNTVYYFKVCACQVIDGITYKSDWAEFSFVTLQTSVDNTPFNISVGAPSDIYLTRRDVNALVLSWSALNDVSYYEIALSKDKDFSTIDVAGYVKDSYASLSGLIDDTTYYFRVRSCLKQSDAVYYSDWVMFEAKTDKKVVSVIAPGNLSVETTTDTTAVFSWDDVSTAYCYKVALSTNSDFSNPIVEGYVGDTYASLSGLIPDTTYYFRVATYQKNPDKSVALSDWSIASITTQSKAVSLSAPANLCITTVKSDSLSIMWNSVVNADSYYISVLDANGNVVKEGSMRAVSTTLSGLKADTSYTIKVCACANINGKDIRSDYACVIGTTAKASVPTVTSLSKPSSSSTKINGRVVSISWAEVKNATGYKVEVYSDLARKNKIGEDYVDNTSITYNWSKGKYYVTIYAYADNNGTYIYSKAKDLNSISVK